MKRRTLFLSAFIVLVMLALALPASAAAPDDPGKSKTVLEKARDRLEQKLMGNPGIAGIAHSSPLSGRAKRHPDTRSE